MQDKVSKMYSWVRVRVRVRVRASLVTAYAALRPRDGFSHPY